MSEIPIYEKVNLTVEEAGQLTNIGVHKIRSLTKEKDCDFALMVGTKILIKREPFIRYLMKKTVI